jgi:hypothetical protein
MATVTKTEKREAIERLREWLTPGDTVYTVLRHVSASGMTRDIGVVSIDRDDKYGNDVSWLGYNAAKALGWRYNERHEGVRVSGCGMDMGFHLVYELAHAIFEANAGLDEDPRLQAWKDARDEREPKSAGYALTQRWI